MGRLGGFDGFEVSPLGEDGACAVSRQVGGAGFSCSGVELLSEEGEQGRPPGLRAVGVIYLTATQPFDPLEP